MNIKDLHHYLQIQDIQCALIPIGPNEPLGRIVIRTNSNLEINISLISGFENWIKYSSLWQFYIEVHEDKVGKLNTELLNHQLPIGFFGYHPDDNSIYFKYSYWINEDIGYQPVFDTIRVIKIIMDEVFK